MGLNKMRIKVFPLKKKRKSDNNNVEALILAYRSLEKKIIIMEGKINKALVILGEISKLMLTYFIIRE